MTQGLLAVAGLFLVYICWRTTLVIWRRLEELGIKHQRTSTTYFDNILRGAIVGAVFARIVWMFINRAVYADVPWGVLPYSRSATEFIWFTVFPWRFFRLTEGMMFPIMWGIMGILIILSVFIPTAQLARTLKLEKRGIMRSFVLRAVACAVLTAIYFGTLIYFAL